VTLTTSDGFVGGKNGGSERNVLRRVSLKHWPQLGPYCDVDPNAREDIATVG
jgi:hypothetical protein